MAPPARKGSATLHTALDMIGAADAREQTGLVKCGRPGCIERGLLGQHGDRPQPPAGWYEVEVGTAVIFAHSLWCAQAVAVGNVGGDATSTVPILR